MANNDIIVSEMTSATQINTSDLMIMTQPDSGAETGYSTKKGTILQVANKMLKGTEYTTDLPDFTNKNVLEGMEELKGNILDLLPVDEASGSIANFETELALPYPSVLVNVLATGGNGTPDNPIPINGYTEANITKCGVNFFSYGLTIHEGYWNASTFVGSDNVVTLENASSWTNIRIKVPEGENITLSGFQAESGVYGTFLGSDNPTDIISNFLNWQMNKTFTVPSGAKYIGLCFKNLNTEYVNYPNAQLELGSTATTYHPYNGDTYTIAFGQTVYGGVLDVTRGKLTVTSAYLALNGSESWTDYSAYNGFQLVMSDMKSGNFMDGKANYLQTLMAHGHGIRFGTNNNLIYCEEVITDITEVSDIATWKTYLSTHNLEIVYPLATPFDIDLTPVQIRALVGVNNVYSDTNGNTTVKFKDSIQHYIDKKIAQTQALIL